MIFFILGLFLGSFLNNIALRLEKGENFLFSRSKCPYCSKTLSWYELIPLISFLWQRGKCRSCLKKISWRYFFVELFTGLWVFMLAFSLKTNFQFVSLIEFLFYLIFLSILFILALYDWKTFYVDDKLIVFGIIVGFLFLMVKNKIFIISRDFSYLFNSLFIQFAKLESLIAVSLGTFFFLLIYLLTFGKGIGFGDVKVAFLIGLFLKPGEVLLTIVFASFFGFWYSLYVLLKTKKFHQPIPFVPFLFLGVLFTIIFGYDLSKYYFSLFGL